MKAGRSLHFYIFNYMEKTRATFNLGKTNSFFFSTFAEKEENLVLKYEVIALFICFCIELEIFSCPIVFIAAEFSSIAKILPKG